MIVFVVHLTHISFEIFEYVEMSMEMSAITCMFGPL